MQETIYNSSAATRVMYATEIKYGIDSHDNIYIYLFWIAV